MINTQKYFSYIMLVLVGCVFLSFLFFGITTTNPRSADYNIPLAQHIISGELFGKQTSAHYYLPGSSNVILSIFIILGIPLNLYGLLSWVILFFVCVTLAKIYGLNNHMSIIYACSICTTFALVRSIGDQSIDKWLSTWFVLSMILLEKPKQTIKYALSLGFSLGMLIGTAYSGLLFFVILSSLYWKRFLYIFNPLRFIIMSCIIIAVGLFWYIRNFIYEGNPLYSLTFSAFPPSVDYFSTTLFLLRVYLSDYLIWSMSVVVLVWYIFITYKTKTAIDSNLKRVTFISIEVALAYLFMSFAALSDIKTLYLLMVLLILAVFLIAEKYKMHLIVSGLAVLNAVSIFYVIPYQPKLFLFAMIILILFEQRKLFLFPNKNILRH